MRNQTRAGASIGKRRRALSWAERSVSILGIAWIALSLAACGSGSSGASDVDVEVSFEPAPRVGDSVCTVHLRRAGGEPLTGATLEVEGNMNHAGMVPVFGTAEEVEPGLYEAPIEFTMGGDWFFIVSGELANGRQIESVHDVPGVAVASQRGTEPRSLDPDSQ